MLVSGVQPLVQETDSVMNTSLVKNSFTTYEATQVRIDPNYAQTYRRTNFDHATDVFSLRRRPVAISRRRPGTAAVENQQCKPRR